VKGLSRKTRVETGDSWKKAQGYVDWLGSYHQSAGGLRNMDRDRGVGWFGRRDALWNDSFKSCMLSMRSLSLSLSLSLSYLIRPVLLDLGILPAVRVVLIHFSSLPPYYLARDRRPCRTPPFMLTVEAHCEGRTYLHTHRHTCRDTI
jgi:hypothetical protein